MIKNDSFVEIIEKMMSDEILEDINYKNTINVKTEVSLDGFEFINVNKVVKDKLCNPVVYRFYETKKELDDDKYKNDKFRFLTAKETMVTSCNHEKIFYRYSLKIANKEE